MSKELAALQRASEFHLNHIKLGGRLMIAGGLLTLGSIVEASVHFVVETSAAENTTPEGVIWNGVRAAVALTGVSMAIGGSATRFSGKMGVEHIDAAIAGLPEETEDSSKHTEQDD